VDQSVVRLQYFQFNSARDRVYVLTEAGTLEIFEYDWESNAPSLTRPSLNNPSSLPISGDFICLSPDSRTAFVAKGKKVVSINLFVEGDGATSYSQYTKLKTVSLDFLPGPIRAMAVRPGGESLIVAAQEDTPTGNGLDLVGRYPIGVGEIRIPGDALSPEGLFVSR
jgi:hypothetical protein